jgi:hypothetical protein
MLQVRRFSRTLNFMVAAKAKMVVWLSVQPSRNPQKSSNEERQGGSLTLFSFKRYKECCANGKWKMSAAARKEILGE